MKSIKKRFKSLLAEIELVAGELELMSSDLLLLDDVRQIADKILSACETLRLQAAELKKADFSEGIAGAEALSQLEEIADIDAVSLLEDRFFAELKNQADSNIGVFLQQWLDKIDERYTKLVELIQQLTALPDEE